MLTRVLRRKGILVSWLAKATVLTKALYYEDQYKKTCETTVLAVEEGKLLLADTIFFGRSCGVKPDSGIVTHDGSSAVVKNVLNEQGQVWHIVEGEIQVNEGDVVTLTIDWERRYAMMKLHTTLHIISAIVWRRFQATVTGSDITPEKAKIDFDVQRNFTLEELEELESEINMVISAGYKTFTSTISREEAENTPGLIRTKNNLLPKGIAEVRIVSIGDFDTQADGGLHVRNINEIGKVKILGQKNKGKGRRRIELALNN